MKKTALSVVAMLLTLTTPEMVSASTEQLVTDESLAAKIEDAKVNITVNPVPLFWGYFEGGADFKVSSRVSLGAYLNFAHFTTGLTTSTSSYSVSSTLFGGGARANFYLNNETFNDGWFISPFVGYVPISSGSVRTSVFNLGALVGYQWLYKSGFSMSLGAGFKYIALSSNLTSDWYASGVIPSLEYRIGFAF